VPVTRAKPLPCSSSACFLSRPYRRGPPSLSHRRRNRSPRFSPYAPAGFLHLLRTHRRLPSFLAFAAALTGLLRSRFSSRGFAPSLLAAATGSLFILLCGAAWFGILTHQSAAAVLALAVLPFLPGDILKVVAAAGAASGLSRFRRS